MVHRCANHPERDAVGVCVHCRKYVCLECTTRIEGVNYCADCLPRVHRKESKVTRSWERPAALLVTFLAFVVCSVLIGTCAVFLIPQAGSAVSETDLEERNYERMEAVADALRRFKEDCGHFPDDEAGLKALLNNYDISGWRGPYIEPDPDGGFYEVMDAYGAGLEYRLSGLQAPVILSAGPNRELETDIEQLSCGEEGGGDDAAVWVE